MIFIAMIFGLIVESSIFVIVCQRPHINSAELPVKTIIYLGKIKQKNRIRSNITCLDLIMRLSVILFFFFCVVLSSALHSAREYLCNGASACALQLYILCSCI